jgi:hypothetical protein
MNNAVTADFNDTVDIIRLMPNKNSILLCGDHGRGKSACVFKAGRLIREQGIEDYFVNDVRLAGKEPGDVIGLLEFYEDDNGNKLSRHCPPAWWAPYFNPNCKGILFLDEINRAHRDVRQGLFQLILDRELNGNKLPEGVKIVAAINDSEDYDTESLDPAFRSRWRIINFNPTQKEWLDDLDLHPLIYGFISDHKNLLETDKKEVDTVSPDRRSWCHLSDALKEFDLKNIVLEDTPFKQFAGCFVGNEASVALMTYRSSVTVVTGEKVLNDLKAYTKFINFRDIGQISKIGNEIIDIIKTDKNFAKNPEQKKIKNLIDFMTKLPLENARTLYDDIARSSIEMLKIFMKYLKDNPEFSKIMQKSISKIEIVDQ